VVAVNLYPFEETVASGAASFAEVIEKIDVGGPSLLRAAAKNHAHVAVLCDPADYENVLAELRSAGRTSDATRRRLAAKVFRRTAAYDAAIARWFSREAEAGDFPDRLTPTFSLVSTLRYGENPHQRGALYVDPAAPPRPSRGRASCRGRPSRTTTTSTPTRPSSARAPSGREGSRSSSTGSRPARPSRRGWPRPSGTPGRATRSPASEGSSPTPGPSTPRRRPP